jgi:hypothetical protein
MADLLARTEATSLENFFLEATSAKSGGMS